MVGTGYGHRDRVLFDLTLKYNRYAKEKDREKQPFGQHHQDCIGKREEISGGEVF